MNNMIVLALLLFPVVIFDVEVIKANGQGTKVGFYSTTCPQAEPIVRATVESRFKTQPTIAPALLRLQFHDCFVRGCDGSVLLNGSQTEMTAPTNLLLRGYDVIEDAKKNLEATCPGVVSCADIVALAARDSVVLTNGSSWEVPTGRKDGTISMASEVADGIPFPIDSVDEQKRKFAAHGLDTKDLVTLVGGHTIGSAPCLLLKNRLYDFKGTGNPDPTIDPIFLPQLRAACPPDSEPFKPVVLDFSSSDKFDTSYFSNLRSGRGILESDQKLWADPSTKQVVQHFLAGLTFGEEFGKAMIKMSNIGVKTGADGEIRKICSAVN